MTFKKVVTMWKFGEAYIIGAIICWVISITAIIFGMFVNDPVIIFIGLATELAGIATMILGVTIFINIIENLMVSDKEEES